MYFFYIDESGTRDPQTTGTKSDGSFFEKEHLYVLSAVSLFEMRWRNFERELSGKKHELAEAVAKKTGMHLSPSQCEVKSTWLRIPKERERHSPFLHHLNDDERTRLAALFYRQMERQRMRLFSVVIDKRKLQPGSSADFVAEKAYEYLLERIERCLREYHPKHQGVIVIDETSRDANRTLAARHALIQRHGNQVMAFRQIVEYPFFTDSALSNGIQLADLCSYNVYRAFRGMDFSYSFFTPLLDHFYCSNKTPDSKLDGLKIWPDDSALVEFARQGYITHKTGQPSLWAGLSKNK